jgi:hypothetical protein
MIQLIYDLTEGKIGIVLAGTPFLQDYVLKMCAKDKMGFRELNRRIGYWLVLEKPQVNEIKHLCNLNGIIDNKAIRFIASKASNFGTLKEIVRNAIRASKVNNEPVTFDLLTSLRI